MSNKPIVERKIAERIIAELTNRGETVTTAESVTGGLIAAALTDIAGASKVFLGGVVSYTNEMKKLELDIPISEILKVGVVSEAIAVAMALAIRKKSGSTWAISATGVAGPEPVADQPVGTVWIGIAGPNTAQGIELALVGNRETVRNGAVAGALAIFERILSH